MPRRRTIGRLLPLAWIVATFACLHDEAPAAGGGDGPLANEAFKQHWFDGRAELTRYALEQSRYGENHEGHAVLVFVTEDFDAEKQVKADHPGTASVPAMKLNFTKSFLTGIYPYSIMTSVFQPLDGGGGDGLRALKTTTSVQEWCGHTFFQINRRKDRYRAVGYSYFESEGDRSTELGDAWLEDDLWVRIRTQPERLPTGMLRVVPSGEAIRLLHLDPKPLDAEAVLADEGDSREYSLRYRELGRTLTIRFETAFPYRIEGWTETTRGGVTRAQRTHFERLAYWSLNGADDRAVRERLGLPR